MASLQFFCPHDEQHREAPPKAEVLGMATYLWTQSPLHANWSVKTLGLAVFPAIDRGSFVLALDEQGKPKGFGCYTFMSLEEELKHVQHISFPLPSAWDSGPALWFLDWVAPDGDTAFAMSKFMMRGVFARQIGKSLRDKPHKQQVRLVYHRGAQVEQGFFKLYKASFERELGKLAAAVPKRDSKELA